MDEVFRGLDNLRERRGKVGEEGMGRGGD